MYSSTELAFSCPVEFLKIKSDQFPTCVLLEIFWRVFSLSGGAGDVECFLVGAEQKDAIKRDGSVELRLVPSVRATAEWGKIAGLARTHPDPTS